MYPQGAAKRALRIFIESLTAETISAVFLREHETSPSNPIFSFPTDIFADRNDIFLPFWGQERNFPPPCIAYGP